MKEFLKKAWLPFGLVIGMALLADRAFSANAPTGKPLIAESPIFGHGTAGCVSISTSAWTAVPTTATDGRAGLFVTVVDTAAANMAGHVGTTTTPTLGITIWPITLRPGVTQYQGLAKSEVLYLISKNTAAETACYQEVKQ